MSHCGGCVSANERCGNGLEKIYPTTAVRFGAMRHIGEFSYPPDMKFTCGAKVVIATDRGIELGEQVSLTCFGCEKAVTREQMRAYAEASGGDAYQLKKGRILREANEADLTEWRHMQAGIPEQLQLARRYAAQLNLEMKLVGCEHIFGGERIVFYFLAEERVDFRELVRMLAAEFQTRIEMRQIGARDEARLVADYETCGRECCCKNFLKTLKPVSMQMAKLQKATLDPSKVSGRCGRLKCCLRFEHESYEELDRKLPRLGVRIRWAEGTGQVIDRQILTQLVKIRTDDERLVTIAAEDIQEVNVPPPPPGGTAEPVNAQRREADREPTGNGSRRPAREGRGRSERRQRGNGPHRVGAKGATPATREEAVQPAEEPPTTDATQDSPTGAPAAPEGEAPSPGQDKQDRSGTGASGRPAGRSRRNRRRGRRRRGDGGRGPRPASGGSDPNA